MLCNKKLIPNNRYLFHVETCHDKYQFQANFLDILNITLRLTEYTDLKTLGSHVSGIYNIVDCQNRGFARYCSEK